jgi:flagellar hook-associated protein 1 FlgK
VKLAALQTQSTMEGGKATFQGSYASLVSGVGSVTRQIKVNGESQQALLKQNELARSAVSGVNLDEEASNLIRYQQAYQASAKSLDIASKLFDTLLSITN